MRPPEALAQDKKREGTEQTQIEEGGKFGDGQMRERPPPFLSPTKAQQETDKERNICRQVLKKSPHKM